ncbi:HNH endonuclease family [Trichomonas vaginalis G3]|uniref:HNH endonuclease family n=1 Tax=Trichomonas vaginalis (strain ATCC PRA-98 / G3) TaxID=412133 RepID=UPI0021E60290|nr:HNH endonuclease family [Trichomonas vaginalis G3]KAI5504230.1 HNH endonuclease family [Trichomonas vaginalis G3]
MEGEDVWETHVADNDYEINTEYPHNIRKKSTGKIVSEHITKKGYVKLSLNGSEKAKHRLIAEQWIPNPDNLPQIDHQNQIKTDNRVENLRWVNNRTNAQNRKSYAGNDFTYVDEISEDAIEVKRYGKHEFEDLFYDPEQELFYFFNGLRYREMNILEDKNTSQLYIMAIDIMNRRTRIYYSKFRREYKNI